MMNVSQNNIKTTKTRQSNSTEKYDTQQQIKNRNNDCERNVNKTI